VVPPPGLIAVIGKKKPESIQFFLYDIVQAQ
jgi:hypothetical protein